MAAIERVCVVGANGMLGRELVEICRNWDANSPPEVIALDRDEMDIASAAGVLKAIAELRPDLVINAAAYTDVDGCESHPATARAVNAGGPTHLAKASARYGIRLVHVSTDYVFDGRKGTPYTTEDPINPQSVYGHTKAEGEWGVRQALPAGHVIVRTSWLFGVHGKNFVKTILKLAGERDELRVVKDQVGCPTYARHLAQALVTLGYSRLTGTYHFCNAGPCSWHEFAKAIVRLAGLSARVLTMTTTELNRPAHRPAYSVLDNQKLTKHTGIQPRPWREALAECVEELKQAVGSPGVHEADKACLS